MFPARVGSPGKTLRSLFAAAFVVAACTSVIASSRGTTHASGGGVDGQQRGGRLVIAVTSESDGFDPVNSTLGDAGASVVSAIYDTLMAPTPDGGSAPFLAESMEPNDDYTSWTMTLRDGVLFHDGTPLTSDAVKANIDAHLTSPNAFAYSGLEGVTIIDDLTLTFDLSEPWVAFPSYLTRGLGMVMAPSMLADPEGSSHPVGTGPFVFEEWIPNERFVATRNPNYWQEGLPYLDEVEFRPIPEFESALSALLTGQVDVLQGLHGGEQLVALQDAGNDIQIYESENGAFIEEYILLNNAAAPFDNTHARRALSFATDRNEINDVLERGLAEPATGPWSGQEQYPIPENFPGFDAERAHEELAAYEADTGEPLRFVLTTESTAAATREAELLQDMWGRVGIEVEITQMETGQWAQSVLTGDYQAVAWQFDGYPDPDQQMPFWHSSNALPIGEYSTNFGRFQNPRVDELMTQARGTIDDDERLSLYAEVAQIIVDEVPWVYTIRERPLLAARAQVQGLGSFQLPDDSAGVEFLQGVVRPTSMSLVDQ